MSSRTDKKGNPTGRSESGSATLSSKVKRPLEPVSISPVQPRETLSTRFIFYVNPTLALACVASEGTARWSLHAAADLLGVHPELLRYYCRLGLLGEDRNRMAHEPTFDEEAIREVRWIEDYRRRLAVSRRALRLVCELRRAAERQHIEIHFLHSR